jgi:hypothetical protein
MADLRIDIASEFTGAKAFKKAATASSQLEKSVSKLGKTLLATFGAAQVLQFGKASVKAFAADEKAAKSLAIALKNTGNGFATIATEGFIARLQDTYKVLDDDLRPAFQTLLTATGSLTTSQSALETALDISAGTGKDLQSVTAALAKGYAGNTTGLSRLGAGLDKATLKSGDMNKIMGILSSKFKGQALEATKTYAGQMDALAVSAANAKEIIGKGLLDSIAALSGADGIDKAATSMETLAQNVADTISGLALLIAKGKELSGLGQKSSNKYIEGAKNIVKDAVTSTGPLGFAKVVKDIANPVGKKDRLQKTPFTSTSMYFTAQQAENAKLKSTIKAGNADEKNRKKQAEILALQKKQLKATKDQSALQKAGTIFDVTQAGIIAALKGNITDEERKRLELQLAILTGNTTEASKLAGEIATAQGLSKDLANYLRDLPDAKNPFKSWAAYLDMLEAQVKRITNVQPGSQASMGIPTINGAAIDAITATYGTGSISNRADASGNVNVYVGGSVISESDLVEAVSNGLLNRSLSGSQSAIGRLKGSFAG